eukprot:768261-Hanusia_phi.AAC.10
MCANQEDMYDANARRCQMGNKYAYAYLLSHSWVMCAPNMPGCLRGCQLPLTCRGQERRSCGGVKTASATSGTFPRTETLCARSNSLLPPCVSDVSSSSFTGLVFQPVPMMQTLIRAPRTCEQRTATARAESLCLASSRRGGERVILEQGDGQHCDSNTPGAGAIKRASKRVGDGNFWSHLSPPQSSVSHGSTQVQAGDGEPREVRCPSFCAAEPHELSESSTSLAPRAAPRETQRWTGRGRAPLPA